MATDRRGPGHGYPRWDSEGRLQKLLRDGIVVHEGTPGAGATWRSRTLAMLETDGPWYARMRDAWLLRVREKGLGRGRP